MAVQINVVGGCIPYSHVAQHDIEKNLVNVLCCEKSILLQRKNKKCDGLTK